MNINKTQQIALIVPTLNEAGNIVRLIKAFQALPYNFFTIIADSNSPDGTAATVHEAFKDDSSVILLNCDARGRGASIIHAYKWILTNKHDIDAIAISDADFSHSPNDFHKLVMALKESDVVIGSRYLPSSKIVGWPLSRTIFSRLANLLATILLRVGITDYTNGYRLFTIEAIKKLDLKKLDADGYIHLSQEILQCHNANLQISEVSTLFVNRKRGKSNFRPKLIFESLAVIFRLWWHDLQEKNNETSKND